MHWHQPEIAVRISCRWKWQDRTSRTGRAIETMVVLDQFAARPKHRIMFAYWSTLRDARGAPPRRRDLDACAFISCLADLMVLKVLQGGADFRYDLVGENIRDRYGAAYAGRSLCTIAFRGYETLLEEYRSVVRSVSPFYIERQQISARSFINHTIGKLILPLSDDGTVVSDLLVCLATIE